MAIYKPTKNFPKDETFALEILSKGSLAILDQLCQQLVPQLEALVDSVEKLWIEERKARRAKAARVRESKA